MRADMTTGSRVSCGVAPWPPWPWMVMVLDHRGRTGQRLFGRLADQHQGAAPGLAVVRHQLGGGVPGRHVDVVAAGVHDRHGLAGRVLGGDRAGERQAGLFQHRQRIDLGAQHGDRAGAVLQDGDDTGAADAGGHFEAQRLDALGEFFCGLVFVEGQFRIAVQVLVQRFDARIILVQLGREFGRQGGGLDGAGSGHAGQQEVFQEAGGWFHGHFRKWRNRTRVTRI
jgi:hypothetical protein